MASINDAALSEFIVECEEILQRVSASLSKVEKGEQTQELVDGLYRDMHTMKGSAQLFGFHWLGKVAHVFEASMGPIRKLKCPMSARLVDVMYECLDLIDKLVKAIQNRTKEDEFLGQIKIVLPKLFEAATDQFKAEFSLLKSDYEVSWQLNKGELQSVESSNPKTEKPTMTTKENIQITSSQPEVTEVNIPTAVATAVSNQQAAAPAASIDSTVRVQVELLDRLMNLVGELVLVRNQLLQYQNENENLEFMNLSQSLDVVTSELQSEVMRTRMQPIGNILTKFQRVVRDLGRDLNKKIDLTLEGTDTELDKTLIEAIKDPLTHIVRNSCDHGIETVSERIKAGKPESGHVLIRSYHEGGQVVIEISDDGKGLDKERIVAKALEKNLLTPEKAAKLQERDIFNLIFLPGFSTAQQVSTVSGRGVGMDVVRTNIEKIGGAVDLTSVKGRGTTISLKIPLTLAIVPAMIVRAGTEKFSIPQVKLVELVRVEKNHQENKIEYLQGKPMYRLRGDLLPLVNVDEILGLKPSQASNDDATNIVVLNADGEYFGLIVDEILDTADIVVKPLSQFLKVLSVFSGATIMGDGSISLILDVMGIAQKSQINTRVKSDDSMLENLDKKKQGSSDIQEFLFFRVPGNESTHAIPLCLVHRLEEFEAKNIEFSGDQKVMRYRDSILPMIDLAKFLNYPSEKNEKNSNEKIATIVIQRSNRYWGLEVAEILEVSSINTAIDDSIRDRPGILGNLLVAEEINVVVDALSVIESEQKRMRLATDVSDASEKVTALEETLQRNEAYKNKKMKVLFAEDVAFFRKHVAKVLHEAGFEVDIAEDGAKAYRILESAKDNEYSLILSDIEMPNMNGLQFAQEVRKNDRFKTIPMIALTTRFTESDIKAGTKAGFNMYLEKLNPEKLLKSIDKVMGKASV